MEFSNSTRQNATSPVQQGQLVSWGAAFGVVGLLVFATNLLTLVIYGLNSRLRRRSVYCLMNLAAADLLVGLLAMPLYSAFLLLDNDFFVRNGFTLLYVSDIMYNVTSNMSMCSLVLVALERMSATVWPWRYRNTRTSKFMVAIAATWFVGLSIHGVLYYIMKYVIRRKVPMLAVLATILLLSITTICVSYVTIYLKLKWQRLQQQDPQDPRDPRQSSETQDQPTEAGLGNETTRPPGSLQRTMIKDRELALTLFIVTVSSLVSWLPYALMQVFALTISYRAIYAITLLQCTNSLMNPAIYALRMREFRSALIQFACKCSRYYPHVAPAEPNRTVQLSVAEI